MVNRYYNPTVYQGSFYTPPVDLVAESLKQAQNQYNVNFTAAEELRSKYIQARPVDRQRAKEIEDDIERQIDSIVAKYSGDYSAATKDLLNLNSKMSRLFSPNGEAGAIEYNYNVVQNSLNEEQKRQAKGEIDATSINLLSNYYNSQGPTQFNPQNGSYTTISPVYLPKTPDILEIFNKTSSGIKPRKKTIDYPTGAGPKGYTEYKTETVSYIDPDELDSAFQGALANSTDYQSYLNVLSQLSGVNAADMHTQVINDYRKGMIPYHSGIIEESATTKREEDWQYRENLRFRNDLTLEREKQKGRENAIRLKAAMDKEAVQESAPNAPSLLSFTSSSGSSFKEIPLSQTTEVPMSWTEYGLRALATVPSGLGLPSKKTVQTPTSVSALLSKQDNPNINYSALSALKEENPNMADSDLIRLYNQQYSKNKDRVQPFAGVYYDKYETTSAMKEAAERVIPYLQSGNAEIYEISQDGTVSKIESADSRSTLSEGLSKALKSKEVYALGKTRTYTGKVPFGEILSYKNKNYVIKENRADIRNLQSEVLDRAFKFINEDSRQIGDSFPIIIDGKEHTLIGKKDYVKGVMIPTYYSAYMGANNQWQPNLDDPLTENGIPISPAQLEKKLLTNQEVLSTYPRKTRSAFENEITFE
jgi:hypothetical protein